MRVYPSESSILGPEGGINPYRLYYSTSVRFPEVAHRHG
nr:MAG TPA: hypothetical protein [Caudoviricetes sp.]